MADESTFGKTPDAIEFVKTISLSAGRKALLGDPTNYQPSPFNQFDIANTAVEQGLKKVRALASDKTRTVVQKHDAARTVTEGVIQKLEACENAILSRAEKLIGEADDAVVAKLDPDRIKPKVWDMIVDWAHRHRGSSEGAAMIREKVKSDREVATVLFYAKGFLLDLPEEFQSNMETLAWESPVPEAKTKHDEASELLRFAKNYPQVRRSIRASWYNGPMADQVATRVEV